MWHEMFSNLIILLYFKNFISPEMKSHVNETNLEEISLRSPKMKLHVIAALNQQKKSSSNTYPSVGPATLKSNTCAGFNSCLKRLINRMPWLSPLFEFTKTINGLRWFGWAVSQTPGPTFSARLIVVGGIIDKQFKPKLHFLWYWDLHPLWTCNTNGLDS